MGVWCVCGVGVRRGVAWCVRSQVVGMATSRGARDETGGAHASGARASGARASGARASGVGDAVNGKCEKKTVTVDAPRYQVVLLETNLGSADMYETLNQDSRFKIKIKMTTSIRSAESRFSNSKKKFVTMYGTNRQ